MVEMHRSTAVNNISLVTKHRSCVCSRLSGRRISGLRPTWSLLARQIGLCETLFPCFRLPIIIPHSSSVYNHSAAKLAKHGLCRDYRNLTRSVGEWEDFLMDEVLLLLLGRNDLV